MSSISFVVRVWADLIYHPEPPTWDLFSAEHEVLPAK